MPGGFDATHCGFQLRPMTPDDSEIVYRIYASTRQVEMNLLGWDYRQQENFLRMQCQAQSSHYLQHYPDAHFDLIEWKHQIIGRIITDFRETAILLIDISLLPEFRQRGLGGALLKRLMTEAECRQLPVNLHVDRTSTALRLYQRLGFEMIADQQNSLYIPMTWRPPSEVSVESAAS